MFILFYYQRSYFIYLNYIPLLEPKTNPWYATGYIKISTKFIIVGDISEFKGNLLINEKKKIISNYDIPTTVIIFLLI